MTGRPAPGKASTASSLRQFVSDFAAFAGKKAANAAVAMTLAALFEGIGLALIVPLISVVMGTPSGRLSETANAVFHFFGLRQPFGQLALLLGLFGALMIVRAVVVSFRDRIVADLRIGFSEAQRLRLAERLAGAQWSQIARLQHARVVQAIAGDVQRIAAIATLLLQGVVAAVMLVSQCVLVFLLAPLLAVLMVGLLAVGSIALVSFVRRARTFGQRSGRANLALMESATQFLGGLKLAMSQNLQAGFIAEFRATLQDLARRQIDFTRDQSRHRIVLSTATGLIGVAVVLVGYGAFAIDAPTLITLVVVMTRMSGPVGQVQQSVQQLANVLPAYEMVRELEAELTAMAGEPPSGTQAAPLADEPIVFEHVSFHHAEADDRSDLPRGIDDVDLVIAPGECVGIGGPSGAGKTTLADLLVGLYSPQRGRITVGGVVLNGSVLNGWRERVGYVSQDPFLFHDTVRRNLAWANPQASEADVWDALRFAGADGVVRRMAQGLDTMLGERGILVSGGERQRIALARAILRKPHVLVLDEATSAVDVAGEREIFTRLRSLAPRLTTVIIAHRAESLMLCDRILHMEAGRCVEVGRQPVASGRAAR